jgi:hypothetical protein
LLFRYELGQHHRLHAPPCAGDAGAPDVLPLVSEIAMSCNRSPRFDLSRVLAYWPVWRERCAWSSGSWDRWCPGRPACRDTGCIQQSSGTDHVAALLPRPGEAQGGAGVKLVCAAGQGSVAPAAALLLVRAGCHTPPRCSGALSASVRERDVFDPFRSPLSAFRSCGLAAINLGLVSMCL